MCVLRNSLTKILSRRLLCSLVFQIKQQQSVPFYFAFHILFFFFHQKIVVRERGKQTDRQTVAETMHPGPFALSVRQLARRGTFSLDCRRLLLRDGCNSCDSCETILKTNPLVFLSPLMLWFLISVTMHGICYCTKIEEVNM